MVSFGFGQGYQASQGRGGLPHPVVRDARGGHGGAFRGRGGLPHPIAPQGTAFRGRGGLPHPVVRDARGGRNASHDDRASNSVQAAASTFSEWPSTTVNKSTAALQSNVVDHGDPPKRFASDLEDKENKKPRLDDDWMPMDMDDDTNPPDLEPATVNTDPSNEHEASEPSKIPDISKVNENTADDDEDKDDDDVFEWRPHSQSYERSRKRRGDAMQQKVQLAMKQAAMEDAAKTNGRFASPLLKIIQHFRDKDAEEEEVIRDKDMSNPMGFSLSFSDHPELHGMFLDDWLTIEPRNSEEAWFDENTLSNMVLLERANFSPQAFYCDPADEYLWLTEHITLKKRIEQIQSAINGLKETGIIPKIGNSKLDLPAKDMPSDATSMVMPFNTGGHWVALDFQPDLESDARQGTIHLYDSMGGRRALNIVCQIMPLFAQLINMRTDLKWKQTSWQVVEGRSSRQRNFTDCGPITAKNCIDLMKGEVPTEISANLVDGFGEQLRYDFLEKLFPLLTSRPITSAFSKGSNSSETIGKGDPPSSDKSKVHSQPKSTSNTTSKTSSKATRSVAKALDRHNRSNVGDEVFLSDDSARDSDSNSVDYEPSVTLDSVISKIEWVNWRELICNSLVQFGELSLEELTADVARQLEHDVGDEEDDALTDRLRILLENSEEVFEQHENDGSKIWTLVPGRCRSVDKFMTAEYVNWRPSITFDESQDQLHGPWDVAIVVIRTSTAVGRTVKKMNEDVQRCQELIRCYWDTFQKAHEMPPELDVNTTIIDWDAGFYGWFPYYREQKSSNLSLFANRVTTEVEKLLDQLNLLSEIREERLRIQLIGNGWDGLFSGTNTLYDIAQRWSCLEFGISLLLHPKTTTRSLFANGLHGNLWAHYKVDDLLAICQDDLVDPTLLDERQRNIQMHHEQFLFFCRTIACQKLDCSLSNLFPSVGIRPICNHPLAHHLLKVKRNGIHLFDDGKVSKSAGTRSKKSNSLSGDGEVSKSAGRKSKKSNSLSGHGNVSKSAGKKPKESNSSLDDNDINLPQARSNYAGKKFMCERDGCDYGSDQAYHLRTHIERMHQPRLAICAQCGKAFASEQFVSQHQTYDCKSGEGRKEIKDRSGAKYQCQYESCYYGAERKDALNAHIARMHLPRRHACEGCGKLFAAPRDVRLHRPRCKVLKEAEADE